MADSWKEEPMNYTNHVWDEFDSVVERDDFSNRDAAVIYSELLEKMPGLSFGDYLRRYLYQTAEMDGDFETIPLKEYQKTIQACFKDNSVPASFTPTTAKLGALAKNWLTQRTVRRNVVFLLGFGLEMSVAEVNEALTKWLRERKINPKNPFEVICWYCYTHHYRFPKFEQLFCKYQDLTPEQSLSVPVWSERSIVARSTVASIHDDESLMNYLGKLKSNEHAIRYGLTARNCFMEMYLEAQALIANIYNSAEQDRINLEVQRCWERFSKNANLSDYEKQERIKSLQKSVKYYDPKDITESDFEQILCAAIPKDSNGNLTPAKVSHLNSQFSGYRFSRQHIGEIRKQETEITRFDLLTLKFFIYSQRLNAFPDEKQRFYQFTKDCNQMLEDCSMGELYIQNPYECFLMMCMLADDPLGTYADVVEQSYQAE